MIPVGPSSRAPTLRFLCHRLKLLHRRPHAGSRRQYGAIRALATAEQLPRIVYAVSAATDHDAPGPTLPPPPPPAYLHLLFLCILHAHLRPRAASRTSRVRCPRTCDPLRPGGRCIDIGCTARSGSFQLRVVAALMTTQYAFTENHYAMLRQLCLRCMSGRVADPTAAQTPQCHASRGIRRASAAVRGAAAQSCGLQGASDA